MEDKTKRESLTIRWQPRSSSPLGNVANWLNSMNSRDRKDKVEQFLITLLPYALEVNGKTEAEIERCYWEIHERLHQYLFTMRQTLGIKTPIAFDSHSGIDFNADQVENQVEKQTTLEIQEEIEEEEDIDLVFGISQ